MVEEELNQYWKTVVDTIQDGLMVVNKEGVIVTTNKALGTITGYNKKELIGKRCSVGAPQGYMDPLLISRVRK
jgi:two-component system response regulator HydG